MADLNGNVEATEVGDDADAEGLDAAVVGNDHLRNRTHTYGVGTQLGKHPVFCRRLEGRTLCAQIGSVLHLDAVFLRNLIGKGNEFVVVSLMHIREARTCGEVLAAQRMLWEEVDVVGDNHDVTYLELRVRTASGIADEERLDAQLVHHTNREGNLFHAVALIEMEASLHGEDVLAAQLTEDHLSAVSFYR